MKVNWYNQDLKDLGRRRNEKMVNAGMSLIKLERKMVTTRGTQKTEWMELERKLNELDKFAEIKIDNVTTNRMGIVVSCEDLHGLKREFLKKLECRVGLKIDKIMAIDRNEFKIIFNEIKLKAEN